MDAITRHLIKLYAYGLLPSPTGPDLFTPPAQLDKKPVRRIEPKRKKQGKKRGK